jgi:transposase
VQQKYACKWGGCIETAPGPERATPGSRHSLDFAVKVAIEVSRSHSAGATAAHPAPSWPGDYDADVLGPAARVGSTARRASRALLARVLAQPVIGLDQTSWKRLESKGAKPRQTWCVTAPGAVVHRIRDDEGAATVKDLVSAYRGVMACDALNTHEAGARANDAIALAGCWAHVFRKFEEADVDHPQAHRAAVDR